MTLCVLLSLLFFIPPCSTLAARRQPNLILVVFDDLGYSDLGCFGAKDIKTPHLDQFAKEGVRATSFYVSWPACTPSRASILTGRYPQRNGLYDMIRNDMVDYGHRYTTNDYPFSPEMTLGMDLQEITLGQVLKKAGYRTAVVGKWDGGRARRFLPLQRGFDYFYGFANTGIDYWTHERYGIPSMMRGNENIKEEGYSTDLFCREAVEYIRQNTNNPFFLYLAFNAPHGASNLEKDSYQAPPQFLAMYPDAKDARAAKRAKYAACVSCLDAAMGEIMATLRKTGLDQETLVMCLSDNGGAGIGDNKPLRGSKGMMWEGGVRVPFMARWPETLPAGVVTDEFLTALELFPTLTHVGHAKLPKVTLDGFNMLPVLQGNSRSERTEMYWERRDTRAARIGNYKWVEMGAISGLFDLSTDIAEKNNLADSKPDVLALLKARFQSWKKEMDAAEPRGPFKDF